MLLVTKTLALKLLVGGLFCCSTLLCSEQQNLRLKVCVVPAVGQSSGGGVKVKQEL